MRKIASGGFVGLVAGAATLLGCARVTVQPASFEKVERPGVPFYLQRPYVVIKQEIPIEGEEGYLVARVDHEKNTLEVDQLPFDLNRALLRGHLTVSLGSVAKPRPAAAANEPPAGRGQSDTAAKPESGIPVNPKAAPAPSGGAPGTDASAGEEEDKKNTRAISTANAVAKFDPSVPQQLEASDVMRVLFLPDLDEKYVINPDAGLGSVSMSTAMGPGSTLNQFTMNADNTEIGRFVLDTASKLRDLLLKKADADEATGKGQSLSAADVQGVDSMVLKYIYIGHATPGAYPILKDSEYKVTCDAWSSRDPYLVKAVWPYTRYAFRVRRTLTLVAAGAGGPAIDGAGTSPMDLVAAFRDLPNDAFPVTAVLPTASFQFQATYKGPSVPSPGRVLFDLGVDDATMTRYVGADAGSKKGVNQATLAALRDFAAQHGVAPQAVQALNVDMINLVKNR